mmetsp:Transcript_10505/g.27947  ORF Transcript_10505/g.27947 Transcript_10505/m.27947 type:complete len:807 (-) Transcript_10505:2498-4918(-)|eukprot:CAMPEP_0185833330 /NCGR_PEP_ID=MMETSP1353-20130828/2606_1 /TAXON_ID=1077150 /ORGANISM="Erythrolobus australicus, Strain CCMP3124" /LENGTH=806 /DNA_ID=CAMNT_0028531599 /DNA_START=776 /DNA_END=3196 /DNA_ORIENTATION=-
MTRLTEEQAHQAARHDGITDQSWLRRGDDAAVRMPHDLRLPPVATVASEERTHAEASLRHQHHSRERLEQQRQEVEAVAHAGLRAREPTQRAPQAALLSRTDGLHGEKSRTTALPLPRLASVFMPPARGDSAPGDRVSYQPFGIQQTPYESHDLERQEQRRHPGEGTRARPFSRQPNARDRGSEHLLPSKATLSSERLDRIPNVVARDDAQSTSFRAGGQHLTPSLAAHRATLSRDDLSFEAIQQDLRVNVHHVHQEILQHRDKRQQNVSPSPRQPQPREHLSLAGMDSNESFSCWVELHQVHSFLRSQLHAAYKLRSALIQRRNDLLFRANPAHFHDFHPQRLQQHQSPSVASGFSSAGMGAAAAARSQRRVLFGFPGNNVTGSGSTYLGASGPASDGTFWGRMNALDAVETDVLASASDRVPMPPQPHFGAPLLHIPPLEERHSHVAPLYQYSQTAAQAPHVNSVMLGADLQPGRDGSNVQAALLRPLHQQPESSSRLVPIPRATPIHQVQHHATRYWTEAEHRLFLEGVQRFGAKDVRAISQLVGSRSVTQVRSHAQKYFKKMQKLEREEEVQGLSDPNRGENSRGESFKTTRAEPESIHDRNAFEESTAQLARDERRDDNTLLRQPHPAFKADESRGAHVQYPEHSFAERRVQSSHELHLGSRPASAQQSASTRQKSLGVQPIKGGGELQEHRSVKDRNWKESTRSEDDVQIAEQDRQRCEESPPKGGQRKSFSEGDLLTKSWKIHAADASRDPSSTRDSPLYVVSQREAETSATHQNSQVPRAFSSGHSDSNISPKGSRDL